ncbi:MAG: DUF3943 domain-containing protein [Candidatus Aminicenantales bacterium]
MGRVDPELETGDLKPSAKERPAQWGAASARREPFISRHGVSMKRRSTRSCVSILAVVFLATIAPAQDRFTLSPYARSWAFIVGKDPAQDGAAAGDAKKASPALIRKPWLAALETVASNVLTWASDRYLFNKDYSHISLRTWIDNLEAGFAFDSDHFSTNFLAHPLHGSFYFNTARSLGMNFFESIPYTFGGSLLWEEFCETNRPSIDDLILTTSAGICIGETMFRLSSQILDDTASGSGRFWREVAAAIVDPARGLNRLIFGDWKRVKSTNGQLREPIHGSVAVSEKLVWGNSGTSNPASSVGIEFDAVYGQRSENVVSRSPFDLIVLSAEVRYRERKVYGFANAYALWSGKQSSSKEGHQHLLGLFQHYDYMKIELFQMGGTSLTGGLISMFPLGNKFDLNTSMQLGPFLFGASNNKYTQIAQRDYNYGSGATLKFDAWLSHPKYGALMFKLKHFRIFTLEGVALEANESQDFLTTLGMYYAVPLWDSLSLRAEYVLYDRHIHFNGPAPENTKESLAGVSLDFRF